MNSELVRSVGFVCLKDDAKAAFVMWALSYPTGDLPPIDVLCGVIGKSKAKAFTLFNTLRLAGFADHTPNGKLMLAGGWVREHKTSAIRVAKHRAKFPANCNVTKAGDVTSHVTPNVTLQRGRGGGVSNVSCNATETLQKEISPTPPLRKTTPNPEEGFGVSARERAPHTENNPLRRVLWREIGSVPDAWLRSAAQDRHRRGLEPVDMALVAADFTDTYGPQLVNPKTRSEWQGQFNKFTRRDFGRKPNGTPSGKSRQIDELARIIEREQRSVSGGEILQDGDGFPDRPDDLRLPGEAWREHGSARQ